MSKRKSASKDALEQEYEQEIRMVKDTLAALAPNEAHWNEYLQAWG